MCVQKWRWCWNITVRRSCWAADVVSCLALEFPARHLSDPLLNTLAPSLSTWLQKCTVKQVQECGIFNFHSLGLAFSYWAPSRSTIKGKEDAKQAWLTQACVTAKGYGASPPLTKQIMLPLVNKANNAAIGVDFSQGMMQSLFSPETPAAQGKRWWAPAPGAMRQQPPAVAGETGGADVAMASGFQGGQTSADIFPSHVTRRCLLL